MELWIRSQDKKILEKCEDLFSAYYSSKKSYAICSHKNMVTLGLYKTEKRALEVLDEIQNMIHYEYNFENLTYEKADLILKGKIVENIVKFYEMPKE